MPFVGNTVLRMRRGQHGATGNYYLGLHEPESMAFVALMLRPGDLFYDVGANVGSFSLLAAGVAGADALALEPVPKAYAGLLENIAANRGRAGFKGSIDARQTAAGGAPGRVRMSTDGDVTNHVLGADEAGRRTSVEVPVTPLDALLAETGRAPFFMKIDVEGYEQPVIDGAQAVLARPELWGFLLEYTPQSQRYGEDDANTRLHRDLLALGFEAFNYEPLGRTLTPRPDLARRGNMLYLRPQHLAEIRRRIAEAPPLRVLGRTL